MFHKAERKQVKLKMALTGPSGSGKTLSALLIAKGLCPNGKIAVIDTENGSASLYSDVKDAPRFDSAELRPPFTTDAYIKLIKQAVESKYDVLIIDSLSHQWAGEGGILQEKELLDSRPGSNSYTNWVKMTPKHEQFKSAILQSNIHIIATMRSKQDYVLTANDKGKQQPVKVGLAPVQRDAFEYEFALVLDLDMRHQACVSKDRTSLFDGKMFQPTKHPSFRIF